jgi:hypothetical protein
MLALQTTQVCHGERREADLSRDGYDFASDTQGLAPEHISCFPCVLSLPVKPVGFSGLHCISPYSLVTLKTEI